MRRCTSSARSRRVRAAGAAVLRRQGLDRACCTWRRRRSGRPGAVPAAARGHRAQLPEVIEYRDRGSAEHTGCGWCGERAGLHRRRPLRERPTARATRCRPCRCSTRSGEASFDAVFGGGRRDEEKARAKERVFSLPRRVRPVGPANQRPELWNLYNGRHAPGEHVRVFPLSNWTELDVWQYIAREGIELPSIYFAHEREVFQRDGMWLTAGEWGGPKDGERSREPRSATAPSATCPAPAPSSRRRPRSTRSSPRSPPPGSPSAAPPAPTTRCPRPPWKTASARGTSNDRHH
jgi:hypothetical protein